MADRAERTPVTAMLLAVAHATHAASASDRFWTVLIAAAIVLVVGIGIGRRRGIKHLHEVQFKQDWQKVKAHKKF